MWGPPRPLRFRGQRLKALLTQGDLLKCPPSPPRPPEHLDPDDPSEGPCGPHSGPSEMVEKLKPLASAHTAPLLPLRKWTPARKVQQTHTHSHTHVVPSRRAICSLRPQEGRKRGSVSPPLLQVARDPVLAPAKSEWGVGVGGVTGFQASISPGGWWGCPQNS